MSNHPGYYEKCQKMPLPELAEARTDYKDSTSIAQLVYEEKMMQQQHDFSKQQLDLQRQHNQENINIQHQLNTELFDKQAAILEKQTKTMWRAAVISSVAAVIASLSGAYLAYTLQKINKTPRSQTQTTVQSISKIQTNNVTSNSASSPGSKSDKVPSSAPHNKPMINSNEKGPEGRLETRP